MARQPVESSRDAQVDIDLDVGRHRYRRLVPLRNRVTPAGEIIATTAMGTFMGNRGLLHDGDKRIVRQSRLDAWLICLLDFRGRRREVMSPGRYTELFFLDEAVALAAGHRPCAECRRPRHRAFIDAANVGSDDPIVGAKALDRRLKSSRSAPRATAPIAELPDGAFVALSDADFRLVWHGALHLWTPTGYVDATALTALAVTEATVLTPALTVAALRNGYRAEVHPSATSSPSLPPRTR